MSGARFRAHDDEAVIAFFVASLRAQAEADPDLTAVDIERMCQLASAKLTNMPRAELQALVRQQTIPAGVH